MIFNHSVLMSTFLISIWDLPAMLQGVHLCLYTLVLMFLWEKFERFLQVGH